MEEHNTEAYNILKKCFYESLNMGIFIDKDPYSSNNKQENKHLDSTTDLRFICFKLNPSHFLTLSTNGLKVQTEEYFQSKR